MSILFSLKLLLFDITSATLQIASHTHSISCHCLINFLCRAVIFSSFCTFRSAYQLLQPSMLIRPLLGQSTETEHWHLYQSPSYLYMPWVSLKHRYWPSLITARGLSIWCICALLQCWWQQPCFSTCSCFSLLFLVDRWICLEIMSVISPSSHIFCHKKWQLLLSNQNGGVYGQSTAI